MTIFQIHQISFSCFFESPLARTYNIQTIISAVTHSATTVFKISFVILTIRGSFLQNQLSQSKTFIEPRNILLQTAVGVSHESIIVPWSLAGSIISVTRSNACAFCGMKLIHKGRKKAASDVNAKAATCSILYNFFEIILLV